MASSLKNFIHSLDPRSLPRILRIQSGFYDEGEFESKTLLIVYSSENIFQLSL